MASTTLKMRQIAGGLDGWIPAEETWTYASATTITVPSGAASKYQKGDKIKITNNSATKYFSVVGVGGAAVTVLVNPYTAVFYGMSVLDNYATAYSIAYFYT
jgi:hypothetical protein